MMRIVFVAGTVALLAGTADFGPLYPQASQDAPASVASNTLVDAGALDILLVEDDETVAQVLLGLLAGMGHRPRHAANGLAALVELKTAHFDLAVLDLDLPGIDGLQLARMIRAQETLARMPMIAVTARSVGDEEAQIRAAGMNGLLRKPVTAALLEQAIGLALRAG